MLSWLEGVHVTAKLRIGTRGSPLALAQAHMVRDNLVSAHKDLSATDTEIAVIKTSGDRILDRHLMTAGGKGLFTKEIEDALLAGDIDCAVHSSKDMPTKLPDGLELSVFLSREDPRDAFVSHKFSHFLDLPHGAVVGTASLRRRAQALRLRPDLKIVTFRGNVQTRLRKLEEGEADATFLAQAGLNRLDMETAAAEKLTLEDFLPAPAQGAVTVEIRSNDQQMKDRLAPLHDPDTELAVVAERAFLAALDGSCRTPIAAHATRQGNSVMMQAMLLSMDGAIVFDADGTAPATLKDAHKLGTTLGGEIREQAGPQFFADLAALVEAEFQ